MFKNYHMKRAMKRVRAARSPQWKEKAIASILANNPNHFKEAGRLGGQVKGRKGFAVSGLASSAGMVGGRISRRGKA